MNKHRTGRPSELVPSLTKAKEYLIHGFRANGEAVPSIKGLARYTGKHRSSLYEYARHSEEFSDTLEAIRNMQEAMLINGGLMGVLNARIVKLMLANHGYTSKRMG